MPAVISVTQLNLYVKSLLESDSKLAYVSIRGEISNFKEHFASGHLYFTLKDGSAAVKCIMFRGNASRLKFIPNEGMQVICSGRISVYERDGVYQLYAEDMVQDGEGDLLATLQKLKDKLAKEGLFDEDVKKDIPKFPLKVGVITSETGAAVKDIFSVLSRRYPLCDIVFCPATVQGETAPDSLCAALDLIENTQCDVVIIGRGGGSIEDLWCFNDEKLIRRIARFSKPIISAVGHETDFTLCDFVCDLRAPTPSAAAELAVPNIDELSYSVTSLKNLLEKRILTILNSKQTDIDKISKSRIFTNAQEYICEKRALSLDHLTDKLQNALDKVVLSKEKNLCTIIASLDALSPTKTLLRGFASVSKNGSGVDSVKTLSVNDNITVRFHDGEANCSVNNIK
ncbi:MAG: exodeoxyribonuclease VII large subunit [Clostridia bacterium]|nr:exodeoxyribonuclease VII large subunit [Clostridia bacterium]